MSSDDRVARRQVLRGAGFVAGAVVAGGALSACGGTAEQAVASPGAKGGDATIPSSKVPVGGGHIDAKAEVVVTQPSKGQFEAFSAICTHEGCLVNQIQHRKIMCPCHGSEFSITNGAVLQGPAPTPLPRRKIEQVGGDIKVV